MLESVAQWIQDVIAAGGYPVVFILIVLESTLVPIPSELVMPFAGFMASQGKFSLPVILVINSVGALLGSGLCYWIGVVGGKPFLERYGKYFLVRRHDIEKTETFFARHGKATILIARFLPVIRHVISVPAGIARMPLRGFFLQTFLGSTIWGGVLILLGYYVGANWKTFSNTLKRVDLLIGAILVLGLVALGIRFVVRRRASGLENNAD
ncbi:MAG TPA: DedA family protein [Kofleriaceae bacterium]|nr:DedA family protein [Kofleriaceae bacterium]